MEVKKIGCDIHTQVEIKKENKWIHINEVPEEFERRNYSTFSILAGVRSSFNVKPISEPKGIPEDASRETLEDIKEWVEDGHSHSYLTLKELKTFDFTDYKKTKVKVVKAFYDAFIGFGGILPKEMSVEETKPGDIRECLQEAYEPTVLIKWLDSKNEETYMDLPILKGIEKLKEIAKKNDINNYEDIRIVFFFDN